MSKVTFEEARRITKEVMRGRKKEAYTKLPMDNIVFGRLSDIPLLEMLVNLSIVTKEHIDGTIYDKHLFQMVMRIIDGNLLLRGQDLVERPDAYAWQTSKVLKQKSKKYLGFHSTEGALTYAEIVQTIRTDREKELLTDLLVKWGTDLLLIHTDEEKRKVIFVTEDIIKAGIFELPNSYDILWPKEGAEGVELTPITVGDALVVEETDEGEFFYIIQKQEFEMTHKKS